MTGSAVSSENRSNHDKLPAIGAPWFSSPFGGNPLAGYQAQLWQIGSGLIDAGDGWPVRYSKVNAVASAELAIATLTQDNTPSRAAAPPVSQTSTLSFNADNLDMWGTGNAQDSSWTWQLGTQYSDTGSIDELGFSTDYSLSANAAIGANFSATSGSVDIGCNVVVNASMPSVVHSGEYFAIDTSDWSASSYLNTTSPTISLEAYAVFGINASLDNTQFDLPGLDPVTFADYSFSLPSNNYSLYRLDQNNPSAILDTAGVALSASLPTVTTAGQGSTNTIAESTSAAPIVSGALDLDQLAASAAGLPIDVLQGSWGDSSGIHLDYTLFDADVAARLYASQRFQFDITSIDVSMVSSYMGETHAGELGEAFIFATPSSGDGSITINATYTINGTLTNQSGVVGNCTLQLSELNFDLLWPDVAQVSIPGFSQSFGEDAYSDPLWLYDNSENLVALDTANAKYTVKYSESAPVGAGGTLSNIPSQEQDDFYSTDGSDYIYANDRNNLIYGYAGNDAIFSYAGNDVIYPGDGDATINAGPGDDVIHAGQGTIFIDGGDGVDTLNLDSHIEGASSIEDGYLINGYGFGYIVSPIGHYDPINTIYYHGEYGAASLSVLKKALIGAAEITYVSRYLLSDEKVYESQVDYKSIEKVNLIGNDGDNLIIYQNGSEYQGGGGVDTFYADWSSWATPIVWNNNPTQSVLINSTTVSGVERLLLATGSGDDFIQNTGVSANDNFDAGAGNDTVIAGSGDEVIDTGDGNDTVSIGYGDSTVKTGAGNDIINLVDGGAGIDGGPGIDLLDADFSKLSGAINWYGCDVSFSSIKNAISNNELHLNSRGIAKSSHSYVNIERYNITATAYDDLLIYTGGNRYFGNDGIDTFFADWSRVEEAIIWGNDPDAIITIQNARLSGIECLLLATGLGDDVISNHSLSVVINNYIDAGPGNNAVETGDGNDTISAGYGNDVVKAGGGHNSISSGDGNDFIESGNGNDTINAGNGDDAVFGGGGDNWINTDTGNDIVEAGDGDDTINSGSGDDVLKAGGGYNNISAGEGNDTVTAGGGLINTGTGNDTVISTDAGINTIEAGDGNDRIMSTRSSVSISAGSGDDVIDVLLSNNFNGNVSVYGGEGMDILNFERLGSSKTAVSDEVIVDLSTKNPFTHVVYTFNAFSIKSTDEFQDIQQILPKATSFLYRDAYLASDYSAGYLNTSIDAEQVNILGEDVGDSFMFFRNGTTYQGGGGFDTFYADWSGFTTAITWANDPAKPQFVNGVNVSGLDRLLLYTGSGNDMISNITVTSNDIFFTGGGNDSIEAGSGNDTLDGGAGIDTAVYSNASGALSVSLGISPDLILSNNQDQDTGGAGYDTLISIENLTGGKYNDWLIGNSEANILNGDLGADTLVGGPGNDTYVIDNIEDRVDERSTLFMEIDTVKSSLANYTLGSNLENLVLTGSASINGAGNRFDNILVGNSGNNILDGGVGYDTVKYSGKKANYIITQNDSGYSVSSNTDGSDILVSIERLQFSDQVVSFANENTVPSDADDTLQGTSGMDSLDGLDGNDIIEGLGGNDTLDGGAGSDTLVGGTGNDFYWVDSTGDVINETTTAATEIDTVASYINYTLGANIEGLILTGFDAVNGAGNSLNNYLSGNDVNNSLAGGEGNDYLDGRGGADTLKGGIGNDTYVVDNSADMVIETSNLSTEIDAVQSSADNYTLGPNIEVLFLTGSASINGTCNDQNNSIYGNSGNNTINGGTGFDGVFYNGKQASYTITKTKNGYTVSSLSDGIDTLTGVEFLKFSDNPNLFILEENIIALPSDGNDDLRGHEKDDKLDGGAGNDYLDGGDGNDTLTGGDNDDRLYGSAGNDNMNGDAGDDYLDGGDGNDTLTGGGNDDKLFGSAGNDYMDGGAGNDYLSGKAGKDQLIGGDGNDDLRGEENDDELDGGAGNDYLDGGDGNDTLNGGAGADTLFGGVGDTVYYIDNVNDRINDNGGNDTAYISVNGYKLPNGIEHVVYNSGTTPLPYFINTLLTGVFWGGLGQPVSLNYSFVTKATSDITGFAPYSKEQQENVRTALSKYSAISGIQFFEAKDSDEVQLRFFRDDLTSGGFGGFGGYAQDPDGGDIHINSNTADLTLGTVGFQNVLHEIGHALGLKHPFETPALTSSEDTQTNTVMTYNKMSPYAQNIGWFDIASIQYLYGVNQAERTGNDTYRFSDRFIWDGAGTDTLSATEQTKPLNINLQSGSWIYAGAKSSSILAEGQAFIGFGTFLENVVGGSGNDTLVGNASANVIDGAVGADTLTGGGGNDTYIIDNAGDVLKETSAIATEIDTVKSALSNYTLGANLENLILMGSSPLNGNGNSLSNTLTGNAGNNIMSGGEGVDTISYSNASAAVTVKLNIATAQATGGAGSDSLSQFENLTGSKYNDSLFGNSGANVLNGGEGADSLAGGTGNDVYIVDSVSDVISETSTIPEEIDTVKSSLANYTLGANLEKLVLTGSAAINGSGNGLTNTLTGNSGANALTGGEGADTLIGGLGADTDTLTETSNASDVVRIAAGDSTVAGYDVVKGFRLGMSATSSAGVDKLDLVSTTIAANLASGNGSDAGNIKSHHIANGLVTFDDADAFASAVAVNSGNMANVLAYLQNNLAGSSTVAFISGSDTYVFQDGGSAAADTLVKLAGVAATGLSGNGLAVGSVWLV